jgi:hypothetical protein
LAKARVKQAASVGIAEHGNSAVLVTVTFDGKLLDRRRIDLTHGLPTHPYHHEGSWAVGRYLNSAWARPISLSDADALVAQVRASAARGARAGLDALTAAVPMPIATIGIRACPELPPTTEERIRDARAANVADSAMYREALAAAAEALGWSVVWYDRTRVVRDAAAALGVEDVETLLRALGRTAMASQREARGGGGSRSGRAQVVAHEPNRPRMSESGGRFGVDQSVGTERPHDNPPWQRAPRGHDGSLALLRRRLWRALLRLPGERDTGRGSAASELAALTSSAAEQAVQRHLTARREDPSARNRTDERTRR